MKKKISLILFVFALAIMLFIPWHSVSAKTITSLDASISDGKISVSGTAESGTLAVQIVVYDEKGENVVAMQSTEVDNSNKYSATISLEDGTYVVKVADYDGGAFKEITVTPTKQEEKPTEPTEPENPAEPIEPEKTDELEKPVEEVETIQEEMTKAAEKEASKLLEAYMKDGTVKGATKELFEKIIAASEAGKDLAIEVSTPVVSEEKIPTADVKKVAEKAPDGAKIAAYFDIELLVKIEGEVAGNITELNDGITITVPLPTDLPEVKEGYTREYYIIRVHDGVAEELDATVSGDNISFKTNLFSTYALAYRDVSNTSSAKTGDNIAIFAVVFVIASVGMIVGIMKYKKIRN